LYEEAGFLTELRLAQLALDPNNSPAWEVPEQERRPSTKMPLFVRAQSVYKSQHQTEVRNSVVKCKSILLSLSHTNTSSEVSKSVLSTPSLGIQFCTM